MISYFEIAMTSSLTQLKDSRTCRIFFSSPFGGMEEEREELTRKYFPQIHHLCNSRGIQFVPVDMRWGITSEAAENAQTVNICLRELDRSDMFVGFFGQRYGWFGRDDGPLQENIENALFRYPWLEDHRGKSVTEMEFLHGHLNNPGAMPAVICFRDKKYDDMKKAEGVEKGDKKQVFKFSPESEESTELMDDLKHRVDNTRDKTLGVDLKYSTPEQAASFIFDAVWKHLNEVLLADTASVDQSARQKSLSYHDAFIANRSSLYVGGDKYFKHFKTHLLESDECSPIAVHGVAGSGKSALLSTWIHKLQTEHKTAILAYHFIGSAPGSDSPLNILNHLKSEVEFGLTGEEESQSGETTANQTVRETMTQLEETLEKASSQTRTVIIIIDGLDKVKLAAKADKPLYWLPATFPRRVKVVVSTTDADTGSLEALKEKSYSMLQIDPLGEEERTEMCVETLKRSGKELSPNQLNRVVQADHSQNAFFLKVTISELSVFGYFRKLDEKIDSLIKCDGVGELFQEYLARLEQDYNVDEYEGTLVKRVLATLLVSHEGMSENELMEILHIPNHVWSPLFFALEAYVIDRSGILGFAFSELRDAVELRYLKTSEERLSVTRPVIDYFEDKRQNFSSMNDFITDETRRPTYELPWLQRDVEDWDGLGTSLSDIWIFSRLVTESQYDLLELWKATKFSFTKVTSLYMGSVDRYIADKYLEVQDRLEEERPPGTYMLNTLQNIISFLSLAKCVSGEEIVVRRMISILENAYKSPKEDVYSIDLKPLQENAKGRKGMTEAVRVMNLVEKKNTLATLLVNSGHYEEGRQLHLENIEYYKSSRESGILKTRYCDEKLGWAYNGIGVMHYMRGELEEALGLYEKSLALYKELGDPDNISSSLQNIALIYLEQGKLEEAVENLEKSKKMLEDIHFGSMHHELGNILTNLGLCYRRLNRLDEAEALYTRSLEIKAAAVGWDHPIIATAYINLSVLNSAREDNEKAYEYLVKAIRIYEVNEIPEDHLEYRRALENQADALQNLDRYEEAEPIFDRVFAILSRNNAIYQCLPHSFNHMASYFYNNKKYDKAEKVLLALMDSGKATVLTYFCLDVLDSNQPPEQPRPEFMTLDHGLTLWPGDPTLGQQKARGHLIPAGDTENLLSLLSVMVNKDYTTAIYEAGASWCEQADKKDMAVEVLKAGLEKYPDHIEYETRLVDLCHGLHRYEEGQVYAKHCMNVISDNPALFLIGGYMCLMSGDTDTAIEALTKVLGMGNDGLAEKAQGLLDKIAAFQAEAKNKDTSQEESEN